MQPRLVRTAIVGAKELMDNYAKSRFLVLNIVGCISENQMNLSYCSAASFMCMCLALVVGCATGQMSAPGPTVVDTDAPTEFTMTPTGLKYKVLRRGSGATPGAQDKVTVHYKGWLDSGKIFDTSYTHGEPASFRLNEVVSGWTEGLQLVSEGGMIELEIPSPLGYGAQSPPGIPPNSTLHFVVEMIKVE